MLEDDTLLLQYLKDEGGDMSVFFKGVADQLGKYGLAWPEDSRKWLGMMIEKKKEKRISWEEIFQEQFFGQTTKNILTSFGSSLPPELKKNSKIASTLQGETASFVPSESELSKYWDKQLIRQFDPDQGIEIPPGEEVEPANKSPISTLDPITQRIWPSIYFDSARICFRMSFKIDADSSKEKPLAIGLHNLAKALLKQASDASDVAIAGLKSKVLAGCDKHLDGMR